MLYSLIKRAREERGASMTVGNLLKVLECNTVLCVLHWDTNDPQTEEELFSGTVLDFLDKRTRHGLLSELEVDIIGIDGNVMFVYV